MLTSVLMTSLGLLVRKSKNPSGHYKSKIFLIAIMAHLVQHLQVQAPNLDPNNPPPLPVAAVVLDHCRQPMILHFPHPQRGWQRCFLLCLAAR
jgi:hypothetical protein